MANYGLDVSTYPDFDATGRSISGARVLLEQLLRLVETETGLLDYEVEQETIDLLDCLSLDMSESDLAALGSKIESIWTSDERVVSASIVVSMVGEEMLLTGSVTPVDGDGFDLVVSASAAGTKILSVK